MAASNSRIEYFVNLVVMEDGTQLYAPGKAMALYRYKVDIFCFIRCLIQRINKNRHPFLSIKIT